MTQAGMERGPWVITTVVSCLPVLVLAMGTALAHMLRADAEVMEVPDSRAPDHPLFCGPCSGLGRTRTN